MHSILVIAFFCRILLHLLEVSLWHFSLFVLVIVRACLPGCLGCMDVMWWPSGSFCSKEVLGNSQVALATFFSSCFSIASFEACLALIVGRFGGIQQVPGFLADCWLQGQHCLFLTIECLDRMERDKMLFLSQVAKNGVPFLFYHLHMCVRLLVDCLVYIVPDICVCSCQHGLYLFSRGMILQATAFLVSTCCVCDMVTAAMLCVWLV